MKEIQAQKPSHTAGRWWSLPSDAGLLSPHQPALPYSTCFSVLDVNSLREQTGRRAKLGVGCPAKASGGGSIWAMLEGGAELTGSKGPHVTCSAVWDHLLRSSFPLTGIEWAWQWEGGTGQGLFRWLPFFPSSLYRKILNCWGWGGRDKSLDYAKNINSFLFSKWKSTQWGQAEVPDNFIMSMEIRLLKWRITHKPPWGLNLCHVMIFFLLKGIKVNKV